MELPDIQTDPEAESGLELEAQETVPANASMMTTENMSEEDISKSDTIPQLDGLVENKSSDLPRKEKMHMEKEDESLSQSSLRC